MIARTIRPLIALAALSIALGGMTPLLAAEPLHPSWTCLPDETVALVRAPAVNDFVAKLRTRTRLGAEVLSAERFHAAFNLLREQEGELWQQMVDDLARHGLAPDDLFKLGAGEMGAAMVIEPRRGTSPVVLWLGWLEPEGDLSQRIVRAVQKTVEDNREGEFPVKRIDVELAGVPTTRLAVPQMARLGGFGDLDFANLPDLQTPEDYEAFIRELREKMANAPQTLTGMEYVWLGQIGSRLLVCHLQWMPGIHQAPEKESPTEADFEAIVGLDQAQAIYARFLQAHQASGARPLPWLDAPGLMAAMPAGDIMIEGFVNPRPLLEHLLPKPDGLNDPADFTSMIFASVARLIEVSGLKDVGTIGLRHTLDGNLMRTHAYVSMPSPRPGLIGLLDKDQQPPQVPAWVSADVESLDYLTLDFANFYSGLKKLAANSDPQSGATFDMVEGQMRLLLNVDLEQLLGTLGREYWSIGLPPSLEDRRAAEEDPFAETSTPQAHVFRVSDEGPWKQLLHAAAPFVGTQAREEQGFTGLRAPVADSTLGVFVGHGYLAIGVGPEVVENVMSLLRNPPAEAGSLRGSAEFQRASALVPLRPCLHYQVATKARTLRMITDTIKQSVSMRAIFGKPLADPFGDDGDDFALDATAKKLLELLPTEEELNQAITTEVSTTHFDDHGILFQGVSELPAP